MGVGGLYFEALHRRLSFLYDCDCDDCVKTLHATSQLAIGESKIKPLLTAVEKAFKQLHTKGSYKPQDLAKTAEYKNLISGTSDIFNTAITDNDIPEAMAKSLKEDVFVFSGLKTHAQLAEASKLLLTPEGKVKSFSAFSNDVKSIKENYNQSYLDAEYQFAVSSAQSAGNWAALTADYDLQYRTAEDDRVRDSHEKLKVTLPQDDAFWLSYYPPNGWRCRCTAVQVRKGKFDLGDSKKAIAAGELATTKLDKNGQNKLAIFRFNPGLQKVVFPPSHPYAKVAGAKEVKAVILTIINSQGTEELKALRKAKDVEIKEWGNSVIKRGHHLTITSKEIKTAEVRISRKNIESLSKHISDISNKDAIKDIEKIIKKGTFLKSKNLENKNPKNYGAKVARGVESYNYYKSEWNGKTLEINMEVMKDGYEQPYAILFDKI